MTIEFDATYSPEDNKLRLYASERLDTELFARVKEAGFKWAPKQELFVAPMWTPEREDLCIELAEEITAEQTTLVERAEAKAERLSILAEKRAGQAVGFQASAERVAQRFASGQPILVGHHSERKARKDQARMHTAMDKAVKARDAVQYWNYRARGVEDHANQKNNTRTRANRIKILLATLRKLQRGLNHAYKMLDLWQTIANEPDSPERDERVRGLAGFATGDHSFAPWGLWGRLDKGELTTTEAIEVTVDHFERYVTHEGRTRWIEHTLNRLAYETDMRGPVERFDDELTPVILRQFARTHGAEKPTVSLSNDGYTLESSVPLPVHLGDGVSLKLDADGWRTLMQSVGYAVPVKTQTTRRTSSSGPLINPTVEQAQQLQAIWNADQQKTKYGSENQIVTVTQKAYSARSGGDYSSYFTINLDATGRRIWTRGGANAPAAVCRIRITSQGAMYSADSVIVITDKPGKALPFDLAALLADATAVKNDTTEVK